MPTTTKRNSGPAMRESVLVRYATIALILLAMVTGGCVHLAAVKVWRQTEVVTDCNQVEAQK